MAEPILVPFGPTRKVPRGYRWCMACDGSGKDSLDDNNERSCVVCGGKGHWNGDDIDRYHQQYPDLCKQSCGTKHVSSPVGLSAKDYYIERGSPGETTTMDDADRSRFSSWLRGAMNDGPKAEAQAEKLLTVLAYQRKALDYWNRHPISIADIFSKGTQFLPRASELRIRMRAFARYSEHHLNVKFAEDWRRIEEDENREEN